MWNFISPVSLIRYLVVWRVNSPLVQLPRYLPAELSRVLGALIAQRLPTQPAHAWRPALAAWSQADTPTYQVSWPIESALLAYPSKRAYGPGEVMLWELKLLGDSAEHGLFLELILPAMEEAAATTDPRWHRPYSLWGRFDISAVYAARGARWEPVVSEGRVNLEYRPSPSQWADGLTFSPNPERRFRSLIWITPVDLGQLPDAPHPHRRRVPSSHAPTFHGILDALMERMALFLPGKRAAQPTGAPRGWALLSPAEQTALWLVLEQTRPSLFQQHALEPPPRDWPGRWIGTQSFEAIPTPLLPYLQLASILHIGKQTHFGCGTFRLE